MLSPLSEPKVCTTLQAFWFFMLLANNRNDFHFHIKHPFFLPKSLIVLKPSHRFLPLFDLHYCWYGYYTRFGPFTSLDESIVVVLHVEMPKAKKKPIAAVVNARRQVLAKCMTSSTPMGWHTDGLNSNSMEVKVRSVRFGVCGVSFYCASVNV